MGYGSSGIAKQLIERVPASGEGPRVPVMTPGPR